MAWISIFRKGHAKYFPTKGPRHHNLLLFQCKNITISNCVIRWPAAAAKAPPRSALKGCKVDAIAEAGLALEIVDGGFMDQVNISNLAMTGIQAPLFIRLGNRKGPGTLKNVVISNITATDETMLNSSITGIPGSYVENVIVKDLIFNVRLR